VKIKSKNSPVRKRWLFVALILGVFLVLPLVTLSQSGAYDTDGDGVLDGVDDCILVFGVPYSSPYNGCPDDDGDGIPNIPDDCPNVPGPPGPPGQNGCPQAVCGNGQVEQGEQCDFGDGNNGICPLPCSATCQWNNCGAVCGANGCEPPGESCSSCPQDCGSCPPPGPLCGDGDCDPGENEFNCFLDCGQPGELPPVASCTQADLGLLWPIVPECEKYGWPELVLVSQRLMNFLIALSIPLAAVGFAFAGFFYVTAAGSEEKIKKAHSIFWKIGIGFLLVLGAWLIVYTITFFLTDPFKIVK
jgi:hypothetical protein